MVTISMMLFKVLFFILENWKGGRYQCGEYWYMCKWKFKLIDIDYNNDLLKRPYKVFVKMLYQFSAKKMLYQLDLVICNINQAALIASLSPTQVSYFIVMTLRMFYFLLRLYDFMKVLLLSLTRHILCTIAIKSMALRCNFNSTILLDG